MNKLKHLLMGAKIKRQYASKTRDPRVWLFGEWFGQRCCDNSMYLANYIAVEHPEVKLYWACTQDCDTSELNKKISKVIIGTEKALFVYSNAGVVFMNQGFVDFSNEGWNYFDGAITVNLWHGGGLWKKMGHDGSKRSDIMYKWYTRSIDHIFGARYYLATSDYFATACESAFGAKHSQIIRAGLPRNSLFYSTSKLSEARKKVLTVLRQQTGYAWDESTKIITYMPTFRDSVNNTFSFEDISNNEKLKKWLEESNSIILQKVHFVTQKRRDMSEKKSSQRIVLFNDVASQVLLAATDLLVTDYSSCFFDYLLLDRPIVHYIYDYDYYVNNDRGVYFDKSNVLCGDFAVEEKELVSIIIENADNPMKMRNLREERRKNFMKYERADSCETIYKNIYNILSKEKTI